VDGTRVDLTAKEFDLLAYFLECPGIVLSRDRLLDRVWGVSYPGGTRTVDVHVGQLRRKLGRPQLIRTVRGAGYKAVEH
jgi:two-component system alkaline phosphatase synthesis response regulator PhoP